MANAFADNLKNFGLRHGEKVGVGVASAIFFVCIGAAASFQPIATTPDQIKKAATASESNLARREERDSILKRLEDTDKIVDSHFSDTVQEQIKTALVADNYKPAREWVTPEPGAGLIRDVPTLIAPTDLYAYAGRGGFLVFELDSKGERIPDTSPPKEPTPITKKRRKRAPAGGGMMAGGRPPTRRKTGALKKEAAKREEQFAIKARTKLLAPGGEDASDEDTAKKNAGPEYPDKEISKGYRWVAITGVLDHAQMLINYREALKNPAVAHPHYARVDLERKTLQSDGTWTDWAKVETGKNLDILDNLPELDEELAPTTVLPEGLVDPLPFLKAGLWEKVHIASLVPKEKREIVVSNPSGMGGMDGMMGRGVMGRGAMGGRGAGIMGGGADGGMDGMEAMGRGRMGMMGGGAMMSGAPEAVTNYWKSDAKKVMVRALDFTVEPDSTYRYRARIVVFNPNHNHDDISPKAMLTKNETTLKGPWSAETDVVTMPPDIMPYALGVLPPTPRSDMKVRFDVVRFHPEDGVTIPKIFEAGPGEILGELRSADIPSSDAKGKKPKTIDFNSRQIVLDVEGGFVMLPPGFIGPPIDRPALALMLRPDGSAVIHNQADDFPNEFRKDVKATYKHELDQSGKERTNSMGAGYAGMMGGMMGMMGGRGR